MATSMYVMAMTAKGHRVPIIEFLKFFNPIQCWSNNGDILCWIWYKSILGCEDFDMIWVAVYWLLQIQHCIPGHRIAEATGLAKLFQRQVVHLHELQSTIVWYFQLGAYQLSQYAEGQP